MNVRLEQLESQIQQGLKPVYIVSGDEPLQVHEACQLIRDAAKNAHFSEREVFTADDNFNWNEFLFAANALSLFASQKLFELRLPSGKPGIDGSKALQSYAEATPENNLLLINSTKLDKNTKNSKWFKTLDNIAVHVEIWPIESPQLPKWIERRMRQAGLQPEPEAVTLLAEQVDGNLLAAVQEIEKLKLLLPEGTSKVNFKTIRDCVVDSSRYNIYGLIDNALKGDSQQCVKILAGLHEEGIEPLTLIWALSREVRQLSLITHSLQSGQSTEQAMQAQGIWKNRRVMISRVVARLTPEKLTSLTQQIAFADQLAKGLHQGRLWDQLEQITLQLAGVSLPIHR